jgi:hypothetical protein
MISPRPLIPSESIIDESALERFDASQWVKASNDRSLLDRGASSEVTLDIVVPEDAAPGGHYALVSYEVIQQTDNTETSSGTVTRPKLNTTLFINVPGEVQETLEHRFVNTRTLLTQGLVDLDLELSNTGTIHVLPSIEYQIKNRRDEIVDTVRTSGSIVLPNTRRLIESAWETSGLFGRHTIEAHLSYGTPQQTAAVSISVFILPPLLTGLFWMFLATLLVFSLLTFRRWGKLKVMLAGGVVYRAHSKQKARTKRRKNIQEVRANHTATDSKLLDPIANDRLIPDRKDLTRKVNSKDKPHQ